MVEGACLQCTSCPVGGQLLVVTLEEAVEGLHGSVLSDQNKRGMTSRLWAMLALEQRRPLQSFAGEAEELHAGLQ